MSIVIRKRVGSITPDAIVREACAAPMPPNDSAINCTKPECLPKGAIPVYSEASERAVDDFVKALAIAAARRDHAGSMKAGGPG